MVNMETTPGSNSIYLNCQIVEFWGIEQTRKSFFIYIDFDNIHINWIRVCLKMTYEIE